MLLLLILSPLFAVLVLLFVEKTNLWFHRNFALFWSLLVFNFSILLLFVFDSTFSGFQLFCSVDWLVLANSSIVLGVDGVALFMIILTSFLVPVCILLSWSPTVKASVKEYNIAFFVLESILFGVFCSLDLLLFYLLFEAVLIPMFFIVGVYGSRDRKIRASYLLFLYTLISSVFMLVAILALYFWCGTTDYQKLQTIQFDYLMVRFVWIAFFLSFAVKMPLVPFHVWLPEAHSEAPTSGSVILAGILLKLGGFGFIRYSVGLFPEASAFFAPLIFSISIFGVVYASLTTIQQIDLKKIIAYSSVAHMGLVTIGIFSNNFQGILGSILLMISHGIVSGALFLCIGVLYERHQTRIVKYYSGLIHSMPLFTVCFVVFTLGNIGLPATSSFVGEILILVGCFEANSWATLFAGLGMVLGIGYSLWLCNRIVFGNSKQFSILEFRDLNRREFYTLFPFLLLTFLFGLYPDVLVNFLRSSIIVL